VDPRDAGVASGCVNTAQQIGGSIGTALLNTIATKATSDYLASRGAAARDPATVHTGLVDGYTTAFTWVAAILVATAVVVGLLMNTPRPDRRRDAAGTATLPVPAPLG
jgi:hypothetical protein